MAFLDLVKKSFLKEYTVEVINNGIDLLVFRNRENDIKNKYGIDKKHLVLGVSYAWDDKKGLDVFLDLRKRLGEEYCIMLVGVDEKIRDNLPEGIIGITRTDSRQELADIYSSADVFVNPTREDNFPTVNIDKIPDDY